MARIGRGIPRQGFLGRPVLQTAGTGILTGIVPALGVGAPMVVLPLPTQQQTTPVVHTVAVREAREQAQSRRFPLQGYEADSVKGLGGTDPTKYGTLNARRNGPQNPQVILPLPTLGQLTLTVHTVAIPVRQSLTRRPAKSKLKRPCVIGTVAIPDRKQQTIRVDTQAVATRDARKRIPHSILRTGIAEPMLRMPDRRLYVQVDLQAVATRNAYTRHAPHYNLRRPATLQVQPVPDRGQQTIRVRLAAVANRVALTRRAPHPKLRRPTVTGTVQIPDRRQQTILTRLALRTRTEPVRRAPHPKLRPPRVVNPAKIPNRKQQTITALLQATQNRLNRLRRGTHPHPLGVRPAVVVHQPGHYTLTVVCGVTVTASFRFCVNRAITTDTPGTLTMTSDTAGSLGTPSTVTPGTLTGTTDTPGTLTMNPDTPGDLGKADPGCSC